MAISSKENFVEQVGIQVFAASMFSYFVSGTLDWISKNCTSKIYNIPLWPLDLFIAKKIKSSLP